MHLKNLHWQMRDELRQPNKSCHNFQETWVYSISLVRASKSEFVLERALGQALAENKKLREEHDKEIQFEKESGTRMHRNATISPLHKVTKELDRKDGRIADLTKALSVVRTEKISTDVQLDDLRTNLKAQLADLQKELTRKHRTRRLAE